MQQMHDKSKLIDLFILERVLKVFDCGFLGLLSAVVSAFEKQGFKFVGTIAVMLPEFFLRHFHLFLREQMVGRAA